MLPFAASMKSKQDAPTGLHAEEFAARMAVHS
jgi:hypothetical protein